MLCLHSYGNWKLIQDNRCDGQALQEKTCSKCNKVKRLIVNYNPIHNWTSWVETGTLKRHFYGKDKDKTLILNKVMTRHCTNCNTNQRTFI